MSKPRHTLVLHNAALCNWLQRRLLSHSSIVYASYNQRYAHDPDIDFEFAVIGEADASSVLQKTVLEMLEHLEEVKQKITNI